MSSGCEPDDVTSFIFLSDTKFDLVAVLERFAFVFFVL